MGKGGGRHPPSVNGPWGPQPTRRRSHERASHQSGRDRGPDGAALVRGRRERQCRADGHRRHQRRGGLAGAPARAAPGRQRDHRQRRRGEGDQAGSARRRRRAVRRHLQLDAAGDQGTRRHERQEALHLSRAVRGAGERSVDLLYGAGAGPAGRSADPVVDAEDRRETVLSAVRRLHLAAHFEPAGAAGGHRQRRQHRRRRVLSAGSRRLRADGREDHVDRRRGGVQHHRPAGGVAIPRAAARGGVQRARRPAGLHLLRRELPEHGAGPARRGALQLPRLLPGRSPSRSARRCSVATRSAFPARPSSPAAAPARACTAA